MSFNPFNTLTLNLNLPQITEATLSEAKVSFFTYDGGDDKDKDSRLRITLYADFGGGFVLTIAENGGYINYGHFDDHNGGSEHTIDLTVNGTLPISAVNNSHLKIEFEPNGDDTWKFHYTLSLKFSNGIVLKKEARNKELSDGKRVIDE